MLIRTYAKGFDQRLCLPGGCLFGFAHPLNEFMGGQKRRECWLGFGVVDPHPVGHRLALAVQIRDRNGAFVG